VIERYGVSRDLIYTARLIDDYQAGARLHLEKLLKERTIKYVVLVGSWDDVPPFELSNPALDLDGEKLCFSDAPYGLPGQDSPDEEQNLIPALSVGRIPVVDSNILENVFLAGQVPINYHQSIDCVVTAKCWEIPTKAIISSLGLQSTTSTSPIDESGSPAITMLTSPEWDVESFTRHAKNASFNSGSLMLFNVHGSADNPAWVGEGDHYVTIHQPGAIADYKNSILISEACYGGALGYETQSIVEDFFIRGGLGFVGCSVVAYGAIDENITAADVFALTFAQGVLAGNTMGEALISAKKMVLEEGADAPEICLKTIISFNLYGAPWRHIPIKKDSDNKILANTDHLDRLVKMRERIARPAQSNSGILARYRKAYRKKLADAHRRTLLSEGDASRRMAAFSDRSRIEDILEQWRAKFEKVEVSVPVDQSELNYRIVCSENNASRIQSRRIVVLDKHGKITKLIATKGVDK
jgi:hypothetical protein